MRNLILKNIAVALWHPSQTIDVYDSTKEYFASCQVADVEDDEDAYYVESVTVEGLPIKPRLKGEGEL